MDEQHQRARRGKNKRSRPAAGGSPEGLGCNNTKTCRGISVHKNKHNKRKEQTSTAKVIIQSDIMFQKSDFYHWVLG